MTEEKATQFYEDVIQYMADTHSTLAGYSIVNNNND